MYVYHDMHWRQLFSVMLVPVLKPDPLEEPQGQQTVAVLQFPEIHLPLLEN